MQYRGFNERELNKIIAILEKYSIEYTVSVPDTSVEFMNDPTKRVDHRFMDNLLQIEIAPEAFDKIDPQDIQKLFDLRIYRPEENPFTEEELEQMSKEHGNPAPKKRDENARMNQIAAILAVTLLAAMFLWKRGLF